MPEDFRNPRATRLSPAARSFLDDTLREIEDRIIRLATLSADRQGLRDEEVTVRDIAAALRESGYLEGELDIRRRRSRSLLSVMAAVTTVFAAVMVLAISLTQNSTLSPAVASLLSATISAFGALSVGLLILTRRQSKDEEPSGNDSKRSLELQFIQRWIDFEANMRVRVSDALGESAAALPFLELIRKYSNLEDSRDPLQIEKLLKVRNDLVHSRRDYSSRELREALSQLQNLTS